MDDPVAFSWPVFLGLTIVLFGTAAFLTGQAVARTWRSCWQVVTYAAILALASRFFAFALFDEELLSVPAFLAGWSALEALALFGFRLTQVHMMVSQYPWLYERRGLLHWVNRGSAN